MPNFPELKQLEAWMREGYGKRVATQLKQIDIQSIPRHLRLPMANLARRVNLTMLGLKILSPNIGVNKQRNLVPPSDAELAEYAMMLNKLGSANEALDHISKINIRNAPETLLYKAFCHLSQWDYPLARLALKQYVATDGLESYQRALGFLNLAAVHIYFHDFESAMEIIDPQIAFAEANGYRRSLANAYQLFGQIEIHKGNLDQAENHLFMARKYLEDEGTFESLFIEKWLAVVHLLREKKSGPLEEFKLVAAQYGYWEGVRDSDLYLMKAFDEEVRFLHLYFGTPFAGYRQRLREFSRFAVPEKYELGLGDQMLDLESGEICGVLTSHIKPGKKIHQCLAILLSDFYRPQSLGALYGTLFPGEHFNVYSSPGRIHQLILRTRRALQNAGFEMEISEFNGNYHFHLSANCRVILSSFHQELTTEQLWIKKLKETFGRRPFSSREARSALGMPLASFSRLVNYGIKEGLISRRGSGPKSMYLMTNPPSFQIDKAS